MSQPFPFPFQLVAGAGPPVPTPSLANRIFNYNESVEPGDGLSVQGHFPANATFFIKSVPQPVPVQVYPWTANGITLQSENNAILRIPDSSVLGYERYELYPVADGVRYASIFINRVYIWFADATEVTAGARMRVQGENLLLTPGLTNVWFTPVGGGAAKAATLVEANCTAYHLEFDLVGIGPGTYTLSVSNGYGGNERIPLEGAITVLPAGADKLGLGNRIPWASKFAFGANVYDIRTDARLGTNRHPGDGTSAREKINAAIQFISTAVVNGVTGGVLDITGDGTHRYLINGGINMASNVVLRFSGGQLYTSGSSPNQANAINFNGVQRAGLQYPNYKNDSNLDTVNPHQNIGIFGCSDIFIQAGNIDLGEGLRIDVRNTTRFTYLDPNIQQGITPRIDARQGPVLILNCREVSIHGGASSQVDYKIGAWSIWSCTSVYVDGLGMRWNYQEGNPERVVNHVLAVDGCQKAAVRRCKFARKDPQLFKDMRSPKKQAPGESEFPSNDGEWGIAETPGNSDVSLVGQATGWTDTGMSDTSAYFSNMLVGKNLHVISGRGAGQVRRIVAGGSNTQVVIDTPWDVTPSAAGPTPSRYVISTWTSNEVIFEGNLGTDGKRGILFYFNNGRKIIVANNTFLRNGMIDFTTRSTRDGGLAQNGPQRFQIMYSPEVVGNVVDARGDATQAAGILFHQVNYVQNQSYGTSYFGGRIHKNKIYNDTPSNPIIIDADFPSGIYCGVQYQSGGTNFIDNPAIPVMQGMIVAHNEVTGSAMMVNTVTGNQNMLVQGNKHKGCTNAFRRDTLSGNANAGRNILEVGTLLLP